MSESQERRKSSKPLMEKRRRARINECLGELQGILEVINGRSEASGSHSKREKAEILEQTVQLVKQLRYQDQPGPSAETVPQAQYRAGFNECLAQVGRFMEANQSALNVDTRTGLLNHLASTLRSSASVGGGGGGGVGVGLVAGVGFNGYGALAAVAPAGAAPVAHQAVGAGEGKAESTAAVALSHRPVLDRRPLGNSSSSTATLPPSGPGPSSSSASQPTGGGAPPPPPPPPRASVPPLPPPPPPPAPIVGSRPRPDKVADALPVQQSPRKGEQPTAVAVGGHRAVPSPALPGQQLPAPAGGGGAAATAGGGAGHVALVLPAQFLSSLVGGQLTTGQVIPLYHHLQTQQAGAPVVCGQPPAASVPGTPLLLPAPADVQKAAGQPAAVPVPMPVSVPAGAPGAGGQLILVSGGHSGLGLPAANAVPAYGILGGLPASSAAAAAPRRPDATTVIAVQSLPTAPSTAAAAAGDPGRRGPVNGVVGVPASLPMNLYVSPAAAYSGGGNGPFANGPPLPNPSPLALGPHWRPWGWEQDQR